MIVPQGIDPQVNHLTVWRTRDGNRVSNEQSALWGVRKGKEEHDQWSHTKQV